MTLRETMIEYLLKNGDTPKRELAEIFETNNYQALEAKHEAKTKMACSLGPKIAYFDMETTGLRPEFDRIICGSIYSYPTGNMVTYRIDETKHEDFADDRELAILIRDELERHHIISGWNCHSPEHRVLTLDLKWVPLGDLSIGDDLLAFDETPNPRRYWKPSRITYYETDEAECLRIVLSDGTEFICTCNHPFLVANNSSQVSGMRWVEAQNLKVGKKIPLLIKPWDSSPSDWKRGYLSGFFDGEGHIAQQRHIVDSRYGIYGFQIAATQSDGIVLDSVANYLDDLGYSFSVRKYDKDQPHMRQLLLHGGVVGCLRFLGEIRPKRLLNNLDLDKIGSLKSNFREWNTVVAVEPVGVREIVRLSTSTSTYISEGYGSHNSKGFDVPFLNTRLNAQGEKRVSSKLHIDAMYQYRGWRGVKPRNSRLSTVAEFWNLDERKMDVDGQIWVKAQGGNTKAIDILCERCESDARLTAKIVAKTFEADLIRNIEKYG